MNSKKVFFGMLGVVAIMTVLVVAAVVYGDIFLHKQSSKLVSLKLDNQVIEAQQASLAQAKKDIQKYSELESISNQVVPQDKDQARAAREIISLANQSGIKIATIGFPTSSLGQKTTAPVAGTGSTIPTTPLDSQLKAVDGIKGLYQLDITVVSDTASPANYARLIDFLARLEQNRRTAQVSQITIQPDSQNRSALNFTLTITLYIKP